MIRYSVCALMLLLASCAPSSKNKETQEQTAAIGDEKGKTITLKGTFKTPQKTKVELKRFVDNDFRSIAEVEANGKEFKIVLKLEQPDFFRLHLFENMEISLVLNPAQPNVSILFANQGAENRYEIQGSDDSIYYIAYNALFADFRNKTAELQQANAKAGTDEALAAIQTKYAAMQKQAIGRLKAMIDTIQPSIVGLVGLEALEYKEEKDYIEKVFGTYERKLPDSRYTARFKQRIDAQRKQHEATAHLEVGKVAPDIELEDTEGKLIKLSSLRGKVVLIDFWASWCKPCRMENPNVVRLYAKYKAKGFEIYGVSLDAQKDAWLKAIEADKLTWRHVSDLKAWQSAAAKTYMVQAIPQTFLLDKDGKIIAQNLRGVALEQKLAEVLP